MIKLFVIVLFATCGVIYANPDAKRLYDDLLSNYNRLIRPVDKNNNTVLVKLGLRLSQLIDLNLKDQILTTNVWLEHEWEDHKFKWDPNEYGGVKELYVPSEHIWLPDIVLYNNRIMPEVYCISAALRLCSGSVIRGNKP
ncbi:Acetylcholine receptor subunit alpha-like 2 [Papilio machaon]|uniref:Acetylcholine receptor subunit alpha-like 2 n=1 Tax=Papilio machaon TaxID=76193 RepID=A0A194RET2_PAPMA|nr:Acetylcholine receptor subunit alpha-like 2 [Papilio machaon]